MAKAIFTVPNVTEVYFFDNYVTVTQDGNVDWEVIEDQIKRTSWTMPRRMTPISR